MDKNIRAPFNFVPLSENVCYLTDDEAKISLDIPFENSISGTINYKITPQTPIFISDGDDTTVFSQIDNRYFIPATSIKGCIRNVLEIMSFSKMSKEMVENSRYGYRDVNPNSEAGKLYLEKMKAGETRCGWMRKEKNKYIIKDCGVPYKISIDEIEKAISSGGRLRCFVSNLSNGNKIVAEVKKSERTQDPKTAEFKYAVLKDYKENIENTYTFALTPKQKYKPEEVFYAPQQGASSIKGKIVLTGQSSATIDKNGNIAKRAKKFEFVFPEWEGINKHIIELKDNEPNCITDFITIYSSSSDYKEWRKKQIEKGEEIPVFFQIKEENGQKMISSIGLSYMYKYPYDRSIHDGIVQEQPNESSFDIAEIIFGTTRFKNSQNDKSLNLRGRIQFSPAFLNDESQFEISNAKAIMASPRASYYPLYLNNDSNNPTWNSEKVKIAGWKRYPACINNTNSTKTNDTFKQSSTETFFKPIKPDSNGYFDGKIRFFNLRDWELGALLSALTFHNNNECYHSLGKGKAYGYGIVKIDISNIDKPTWQDNIENVDYYLKQYELFINKKLNSKGLTVKWQDTIQIKTLFAMAKREHEIKNLNEFFTYMSIQKEIAGKKINEFVNAKNNKLYLPTFLDIINPNNHSSKKESPVKTTTHNNRTHKHWPPMVGERYNAYIKNDIVDIWHPFNREYNIRAKYILTQNSVTVSGKCKIHILKIDNKNGKDIYTLEII